MRLAPRTLAGALPFVAASAFVAAVLLGVGGCGGDNLALCDGCGTRTSTPEVTVTPSPTPSTGATGPTSFVLSPLPVTT